jgi:hypothetical protein
MIGKKLNKGVLIFVLTVLTLMMLSSLNFSGSNPPPGWYIQYTPYGNRPINDIMFLDSLNGWAVTSMVNDTAYILKTTNGGNNWTIIPRYQPGYAGSGLSRIQMLNLSTGFACGGYGNSVIIKTTNGGYNWTDLNLTQGTYFSDMEFEGQDTGWVCDELDGYTYRTTNCGASWQLQNVICNHLSFANSKTGWAVNQTYLYKTTNAGVNWNLIVNDQLGFLDPFFVNENTGYVGSGGYVKKSTNGGQNWVTLFEPQYAISYSRFYFLDSETGWLGAGSNKLYVIRNGGAVYGYQNTPTLSNITAYFLDTLKGWSGRQSIIHTTDGGGPVTGTENNGQEITLNYKLYQNYPNPFNPKTIIKFELPVSGAVTLKVYDVAGKEVKTLFNGNLNAGEYHAVFDGSGLTGGVYFYKLITKNYTKTKRMILVK